MRSREEVLAQSPVLWDVIAFVNGRFERHQSHDTLPDEALYPTCAADMAKLSSQANLGIPLLPWLNKASQTAFTTWLGGACLHATLWAKVRKMPVTHPATYVPPYPIPRDSNVFAPKSAPGKPGRRKLPGSTSLHHRGRWPGALRGIQMIKLVYQPGRIEAHDLALAALPRRAQDCVRAMRDYAKRTEISPGHASARQWTRKELAEVLSADPRFEAYLPVTAWQCWTRYELRIRKAGLIQEFNWKGREVE